MILHKKSAVIPLLKNTSYRSIQIDRDLQMTSGISPYYSVTKVSLHVSIPQSDAV